MPQHTVGSKRWQHLRKVVTPITVVKLIFRPKPTSPDAADSSGFAPRTYRASSSQSWGYSTRCSGMDKVGRLVRITFAQLTTRVLLRVRQDGV
jgi:hypothetical protein